MQILFSGAAGVAREIRRTGVSGREWKKVRKPDKDLTSPVVQRGVSRDTEVGRIFSAMLAPPCGSWSLSNSSVHRTHTDPWGQGSQPSSKARVSVDLGNSCALAALEIIRPLEQQKKSMVSGAPANFTNLVDRRVQSPRALSTHLSGAWAPVSVWCKVAESHKFSLFSFRS